MIEACREHGLPPPEFEELGTHFHVTIRLQARGAPHVDELEARILKAIGEADGLSTKHTAEAVAISTRAARTRLKALVDRGLIVEVGSSPTDPKRVQFTSDAGRKRTAEP